MEGLFTSVGEELQSLSQHVAQKLASITSQLEALQTAYNALSIASVNPPQIPAVVAEAGTGNLRDHAATSSLGA